MPKYLIALHPNSSSILEWVWDYSREDDTLYILSIIDEFNTVVGEEEMSRQLITSLVHKLQDKYEKHVHYQILIVAGADPGELIVQKEMELKPAMIIMGKRNRNALTSVVLGSCSLFVLEHANCPVTIIKT
jgi:nucleotide-binding universal stress UspA family protein